MLSTQSSMQQIVHIVWFQLILALAAHGLANCPSGCQCDDNTLVVQCGEGELDVLPIALNPSIKRLVIKSNKIKTIDSSIQFYAELSFLDLSSNHLMTVPQRTFVYQKKLQELHLNHNKIGRINNVTFLGLSAVSVLNLRGNLISELQQDTFSSLTKLEELNLGANRISLIHPRAFEGTTQLRILYLDDNALTSVPDPAILQTLPNLAELFLGMNTITNLPHVAFQDLKGLIRLDMKETGLQNVSHDAFHGLDSLRILDLSGNRLTFIPTFSLSVLIHLEECSIGQNDFKSIPVDAFVGLKRLTRLNINGAMRLKSVMSGAFSSNNNLEYLSLSANRMLTDLQVGAFSGLIQLRHLHLKANSLTSFAEGLISWNDLNSFDLTENPISCDCRIMWLSTFLTTKNKSHNNTRGIFCEFPEHLRGEKLENLNPEIMGCSNENPRKQALVGALLVGCVATFTALSLMVYRYRRKIRLYLKTGVWGTSTMGRKEREYQKTFCDEDYMTRLQHQPCNLNIQSTFPNTYTLHQPSSQHPTMNFNSINKLNADLRKNIQILSNSSTTDSPEKVDAKPRTSDESTTFMIHINSQQKHNYLKNHFLPSTNAVSDSCYVNVNVPTMHSTLSNKPGHYQVYAMNDRSVEQQQQRNSHFLISKHNDIMDSNSLYGGAHYALPLELIGHHRTPPPPALPPALPQRNTRQSMPSLKSNNQPLKRSPH